MKIQLSDTPKSLLAGFVMAVIWSGWYLFLFPPAGAEALVRPVSKLWNGHIVEFAFLWVIGVGFPGFFVGGFLSAYVGGYAHGGHPA
jgi:hypothetical protein